MIMQKDLDHLKENDKNLSGDDIREGLTAVISVKIKNHNLKDKQRQNLEIVKLEELLILLLVKD